MIGLLRAERMEEWLVNRPDAADLLLALGLLLTLFPISVGVLDKAGLNAGWSAPIYAALLTLHAAVALRRRAVQWAFSVAAAAALVVALAPDLEDPVTSAAYPAILLPSCAVYLVVAYTTSALGSGRWPLISFVVGVAGSLLVIVRARASGSGTALAMGGPPGVLMLAALLLASIVAAWALGRLRRLRTEQMAALAERAERAEAERERRLHEAATDERARIARELHDVIAHSVTLMVRLAEGGRYVAAADPQAATTALTAIAAQGREALTDIRTMLGVLNERGETSTMLDPQPCVDDIPQLVERMRASGQRVAFHVEGDPRPLDRAAHLAAYRLVQEALTNVLKHAGTDGRSDVRVTWGERILRLEVCDDGIGSDTQDGAGAGRGLIGMRERLQLVGGDLLAGPRESGGFAVVGEIPLVAERGAPQR